LKRYERYAEEISRLIADRRLAAGERLPSVRQASASRGISPATVFQAYYLLEARGLVEARPRSGYYVAAAAVPAAEPALTRPRTRPTGVAVSELVFEVLGSARERDVVPLGSAFPSPQLFPLARLARGLSSGLKRLDPWRTVEDLAPGSERLRRQIALRYRLDGLEIDADEIVITNGALEALNLSLQALTRPGDTVLVESPTFYAALQALEQRQLKALEVACHPRDGIDLAALERALDRQPVQACWLMPNFQNPLGSLMPDANKRALVELLATRGVPLIEDDVYGELHHGARRPPPAKAWDRAGQVLHCASFSKCLAPGYRVGWVAAGRHSRAIERLKLMTSLSAAVPSQLALSEYLARGGYERHLRRLRAALARQQALALRVIAEHFPPGTRVTRPEGGYFLWLELPPAVDALELHRLALAQRISLAPGQLYSTDRRFRNFVRINHGHPDDARFEAALGAVGALAGRLARD
jgi:DNA-binding transcriptional MocR family regulator